MFLHQGGVAAVSAWAEGPLVVVARWKPAAILTQVSWPGIAAFRQGSDCSCPKQAPYRAGEDKLVHLPRGDKVRELCLSAFTCVHHSVSVPALARQVKVTSGGLVPAGTPELGEVAGGHRRMGREPLVLW